MGVVIEGREYSTAELEAMDFESLRELAFKESAEQERLRGQKSQPAETETPQELGQRSLAENLSAEELKKRSDSILTERQAKQQELVEQNRQQAIEDEWDKRTAGMSLEEIRQAAVEQEAKQRIAESPEGRLEAEAQSAEQRLQDADFVRQQLEKQTQPQLEATMKKVLAEQMAEQQRQFAIAQRFVQTHPSYIACPENQAAMEQFIMGAGYRELTPENLELAFSVLSQRGKLRLVSADELQRREKIREQVENPVPRRKSSSVWASHTNRNLYDQRIPSEAEIEDMNLPLEELRRRAVAQIGEANDFSVSNFRY